MSRTPLVSVGLRWMVYYRDTIRAKQAKQVSMNQQKYDLLIQGWVQPFFKRGYVTRAGI